MNMRAEIFCDFTLEAAHRLENVPSGHKCARIHGHTYRCTVRLFGSVSEDLGWIVDYAAVRAAWNERIRPLCDHQYLNETLNMKNTTSEEIARWVFETLREPLPGLSSVTVRETATCGATFFAPGVDR